MLVYFNFVFCQNNNTKKLRREERIAKGFSSEIPDTYFFLFLRTTVGSRKKYGIPKILEKVFYKS